MEPEVVVVGGGAIGVTAAYELARRGVPTRLLERAELGAGCSSGNAGLLCPSHSAPLATPAALREGLRDLVLPGAPLGLRPRAATLGWLARFVAACRAGRAERAAAVIRALSVESLELHAGLASLGTGFERRGILSVYETAARFRAGGEEAARSGLPARVLSATAARGVEPSLRGAAAGAVYFPDEAHVDPRRYVEALGEAAAAAGADLSTGTEVTGLRPRDGGIAVETRAGTLGPATVVLAAGAWTAPLARGLGVSVPVTGGKGYHLDLAPADGDPVVPMLLQEARAAVTPLPGRLRVAGTLEIAGLDLGTSAARLEGMRRAAARVLGLGREREVLDVWAGLRPCTPDGLPVIGSPAGLPSLVLATGHAMKGISLAPVTAAIVAGLVAGEAPARDLSPLRPDRF